MQIHEARAEDLSAMEALYIRSVAANEQGFIQDLSYHGDIKQLAQDVQAGGGLFAVGEVDGKVVAMGCLRKCSCKEDCAELCKLHVDATLQGKGYGQKLSEYFLNKAPDLGFTEVELHVTTSQTPAIGLYEKLGFNPEHTEMWSDPKVGAFETLHMRKHLTHTQVV